MTTYFLFLVSTTVIRKNERTGLIKGSKRVYSIDFLRGIVLLIMAYDHFHPAIIYKFTLHKFVFYSAADGFVFLSGLIAGIVYNRYLNVSFSKTISKSIYRSFVIYKYHVLSLLFIILIASVSDVYLQSWNEWSNAGYFEDSFFNYYYSVFFLAFQPRLFGILPIYIILIMIVPFILYGIKKGYFFIIVILSICLWSLQQFTPFIQPWNLFDPDIIFSKASLNIYSWQLYFVIGVCLGAMVQSNVKISFCGSASFTKIILIFFLLLIFIKLLSSNLFFPELKYWFSKDRQNLSIFRVLHFFISVYLIQWLVMNYSVLFRNYYIEKLGRNSLQVFVYHVLMLYLCMPLIQYATSISIFWNLTGLVFFLISLFFPVILYEKYLSLLKK